MKSENSILLVVNPIAGDSDKTPIINLVTSEVKAKNLDLEVFKTTGQGDKEAIVEFIANHNPSRILVAGGDGTISLVASCIYGTEICLGIIPAGSANGMAVNIGLPTALKEQINIALSGEILKTDVIFVNDIMCLHIADLGINAELIKNYENSGIRGKLGYFIQSFPTLFNSDFPFEFTIEADNEVFKETGILLAIANANKFGTGANINPNGILNDGKFEVLVFKNLDLFEILKTTQENPEMSSDFVKVISTHKAKIISKSKVPFQVDGEYINEIETVNAYIKHEILSIAVPQSFLQSHNLNWKP